jgi:putative intracellular protease/amidase
LEEQPLNSKSDASPGCGITLSCFRAGIQTTKPPYEGGSSMGCELLMGGKAILLADGFEQSELLEPRQALDGAGAQTQVVSPVEGNVKGGNHTDWGDEVPVDGPLNSADPSRYDGLLLPGRVMNPDTPRMNPDAMRFAKHFLDAGKP